MKRLILALSLLVFLIPGLFYKALAQETPGECAVYILNLSDHTVNLWFNVDELVMSGSLGTLEPGMHMDMTGPCVVGEIDIAILSQVEGAKPRIGSVSFQDSFGVFHPHAFLIIGKDSLPQEENEAYGQVLSTDSHAADRSS